ncbi:MAG: hypothetical protein KF788_22110 [Piscinibacter sp.]|nr:hypothetical protein [Piscinibacter sp.]
MTTNEALGRRCTLVLLAAMGAALMTGLIAWGAIPLSISTFNHADDRSWLGIPNAFNVLSSVPLMAAAWWGLRATSSAPWPRGLVRAWTAFHACVIAAALLAALHHAQPTFVSWLMACTAMCGAFAMLTAGALAERVDARLARPVVLGSIGAAVIAGAVWVAWSRGADIRPFLLIEALPVLLLPAGAMSLPGAQTRASDWLLMLAGYAVAKLADLGDERIFAATGWIGGHALLHLLLAAVTAWLAYAAVRVSPSRSDDGDATQRQASLKTSG